MKEALDHWLMRCEGLRLKPYNDEVGCLTIGYGHNLSANGIPITIADQLLDSDILNAQKDVLRNLPWVMSLDEPRQDAFTHLCFWIGIGSLLNFKKMLAAAQAGDWQTAHDELLNSNLFNAIPQRATEVANRPLTGDTP